MNRTMERGGQDFTDAESAEAARPADELSFEESLGELEALVGALEAGGVPLETSLEILERGMVLAARCESVLGRAELALERIALTGEGEIVSEPVEEF